MRKDLQTYIESRIIPQYAAFDKAHREDHVRAVIGRAMEMADNYPEIPCPTFWVQFTLQCIPTCGISPELFEGYL